MITGLTITYVEEAIGIVRAAATAGMPVAMSFTVETDGRLPTGEPLAEAIEQVDAETRRAAYFMVNCAHPTHFADVLEPPARGPRPGDPGQRVDEEPCRARRVRGARRRRPVDLAPQYLQLGERLPHLTVLGGCCGTDIAGTSARYGRSLARGAAKQARRSATRSCSVRSVRKRAGSPAVKRPQSSTPAE